MEIETLPSRWAKSTKDRIPKYLEEFLVNSLDHSVRRSTQSLILSLYKKGNNNQKVSILNQIATKISNIQGKGKTSQQILQLVGQIVNLKDTSALKEQQEILALLGKAMQATFSKWLSSTQFDYFCFCENILNNQGVFKPYLYELNGCMKCCKEVQNTYTPSPKPLSEITESAKYGRKRIEFTLKRTYSIKEFSLKLPGRQGPKNIACSLQIRQDNGDMLKKGPINPTQNLEFTTNFIQIEIEGPKTGTCIGCNRDDDNSFICPQCRKILDIQAKYKVVKGSSNTIMKQLEQTYNELALIKRRSYNFYQAIKGKKTMKSLPIDITEAEREYTKLMLNLSLLGESSQRANPEYKPVPEKYTCPSCLYYEVHNFLTLLGDSNLLEELYKTNVEFLAQTGQFLSNIHVENTLPNSIRIKVCKILGTIKHITFSLTKNAQSIHLLEKIPQHLSVKMFQVFKFFFLAMKQNSESQQANQLILKYIATANWSPQQKVSLVLLYFIQRQDLQLVHLPDLHLSQEIKSVASVSLAEAQVVLSALSFNPNQILTMEASNELILLLKYLPAQLVPRSDIATADPLIIPFINNRLPIMPKELPIVLSPQPILPLGDFQNLPVIASNLSAEDGAKLAMQILQFKRYWNFNLYRTLDSCELALNKQGKEKQILLCLRGLNAVEDNFFLDKLQTLLVPKRREFIIKAELPEKEFILHKDKMDHPVIKQKQIRTTSLPGDTMKEVHDWIMAQIKIKMPTDLIVQDKIIDDLSVPIEVVHRKLYPQTQSKSTPQIIKVIYRVRGIFGQNTEDKLVTQGDDQMNQFLLSAPALVQPLSSESSVLGLDVLLKIFKNSRHKSDQLATRRTLLKIMDIVFKSEAVQIKAIQRNHVDLLIREVLIFLASKDEQLAKQKQILLEIVSKLIDKANNFMDVNMRKASTAERKGSENMDIEDDRTLETANKNVNLLLDKISESDLAGMTKLLTPLIRLLPFSSKDVPEISQKIYNYFSPSESYKHKIKPKLERMLTFMEALPGAYSSFKAICYNKKFLTSVLDSLAKLFPTADTITDTLMMENEYGLTLDLSIIKNSVEGCEPLQRQISSRGLIPIFHKLSVTSSQCTKVVSAADQLIKNLSNKAYVLQEIADQANILITQFAQEKQKRAFAAKQNRLQKQRKKQSLIAQSVFNQTEIQLTEETKNFQHLKCVSCKQGYGNSNSLLGIYLYSNKAEIYAVEKWWADPKKVASGTSVTFFTVIHHQCHRSAHSYDDQKKVEDQKKIGEWEGAQKRNADSKCNSWIPIRGPHNSDEQFERSARKYFELNKGVGFWVPLNDLKGLLKKFGNLENLAKDSKSSASSNARLVCVQLAFICSYAKKAENFKQVMEGFYALKDKEIQNNETFCLFLTCLMFNVQHKDFPQYKKLSFDKIVAYASKNQETKFATARPLLIVLGMVAEVYRLVHSRLQANRDILTGVEEYVSKNLGVIEQFEELAILYKNSLSKKSSIEQFQADLFK